MMNRDLQKAFVSAGNRNEVTSLPELRKQYGPVFRWLDQVTNPYLSQTGEANCARRFRIPLEVFQQCLRAYRGEAIGNV